MIIHGKHAAGIMKKLRPGSYSAFGVVDHSSVAKIAPAAC